MYYLPNWIVMILFFNGETLKQQEFLSVQLLQVKKQILRMA